MKLTKYQHACFTVEHEGKLIVIDPGTFTTDLGALDDVSAIVVTHKHTDHFDPTALQALIARSPDALIYAPEEVLHTLGDSLPSQAVAAGDIISQGPFTLEFTGGQHAVIHDSIPPLENVGVLINDRIYYPGDSFADPVKKIDVLALPVAAPWMRISEAIDFLLTVSPRYAFPTHDAICSDAGKQVVDGVISQFAAESGITYRRLANAVDI